MPLLRNPEFKRAIAYYRHSAEDKQENSVPIQREQTHKFATQNGIAIIHEEADEGKSGLSASRPGFQHLFQNWVLDNTAPAFEYVLVYDVSRWGRFQDKDEAGYYEFLCRKAGKQIIYVSQGLINTEDHLTGGLRTSLERFMAAEYSRQLSKKVLLGAVAVSRQGFSAGGPPPYGMQRLLLDSNKKPIRTLSPGEHKQIANERVTLVPKEGEESNTVRNIFLWFVKRSLNPQEISTRLNKRKSKSSPPEDAWRPEKVRRILTNRTYAGTLAYNKTSNHLKKGKRNNPESDWVVVENAFPALIEKKIFDQAQIKLQELKPRNQQPDAIVQATRVVKAHIAQLTADPQNAQNKNPSLVPVIFSVTRRTQAREWCFVVPHKLKQQKKILAVGVKNPQLATNPEQEGWIEELFVLPGPVFNPMMFFLLSEKEHSFQHYLTDEETFDRTAQKLLGINKRDVGFQA